MDTTQAPSGRGLTGRIIIQEKIQINTENTPLHQSVRSPWISFLATHRYGLSVKESGQGQGGRKTTVIGSGISTKDQGKAFLNEFATKPVMTGQRGGKTVM